VLAKLAGGARRAWRPVGLDAEGLDLGGGGEAARVDFDAAATDAQSWQAALARIMG
jgi:hypothetical protein